MLFYFFFFLFSPFYSKALSSLFLKPFTKMIF